MEENINIRYVASYINRGIGQAMRDYRELRSRVRELNVETDRAATATGRWSGLLQDLRRDIHLSTRDLTIFRQTIRLLALPALAAVLGTVAQAFSAAAAGAASLAGAMRPLVGLIGGLPAALLAVKQATATMQLAFTDFDKLLDKTLNSNIEDFNKALEDMTVQQRRLARDIRTELRPAFLELRNTVQRNVFGSLRDAFREMKGFIPIISNGLTRTSQIIANVIRQFGRMAGSTRWAKDLERLMAINNRSFMSIGQAALSFSNTLRIITVEFAPLVRMASDFALRLSEQLEVWTMTQRASGRFRETLNQGWQLFQQLFRITRNWGSAFMGILRAAEPVGRELVGQLERASKAFADWVRSAQGRNALRNYFMEARPAIEETARLVRDLVQGFFNLARQPGLTDLIRKIRTELGPALGDTLRTLTAAFAPALVDLLVAMAQLLDTLAQSSGPLTLLVQTFEKMAEALNGILKAFPGLQQVLFVLLAAGTAIRALRFVAALGGISQLINGITQARARFQAFSAEGVAGMNRVGAAAAATGAQIAATGAVAAATGAVPNMGPNQVFRRGAGYDPRMVGTGFYTTGPTGMRLPMSGAQVAAGGAFRNRPILGRLAGFTQRMGGGIGLAGGLGVLGAGATIAGGAIGGPAGSALALGGLGASLGAAFGPWGAAGGAIIGVAAALLTARKRIDETVKSTSALRTTFTNAANAVHTLKFANQNARDSAIGVEQAEINLIQAQRSRRELLRGLTPEQQKAVKGSLEYRQATLSIRASEAALKDAQIQRKTALLELKNAQAEHREQTVKLNDTLKQQNQRFRDSIDSATKLVLSVDEHGRRTRKVIPDEEKRAKILADYIQKMRSMANELRERGNPQLAKQAELAAEIAETTGKIPRQRTVQITLKAIKDSSAFTSPRGAKRAWDIIETGKADAAHLRWIVRIEKFSKVTKGAWDIIEGRRKEFTVIFNTRTRGTFPTGVQRSEGAHGGVVTAHGFRGRFNMGGMVPGRPVAADSVPAMLSPGEAVLTSSGQAMVDQMAGPGAMSQILASQVPHFRHGGLVGRKYSDRSIARFARSAGFQGLKLIHAIAVALAESGGMNIRGRADPRDRGLWQINSRWHPEVDDHEAFTPSRAARETFRISRRGSSWRPWHTWTSGAYRRFMPRARAVANVASGPAAGIPGEGGAGQFLELQRNAFELGLERGRELAPGGILPDLFEAFFGSKRPRDDDFRLEPGQVAPGTSEHARLVLGRMQREASRINNAKYAYKLGGGHVTPAPATGPYDCSSSVSRVLQFGGFRIPTMVSSQFMNWGRPGKGRNMTIAARPGQGSVGHVYMLLLGRGWGTSDRNYRGGPGWLSYNYVRSGFNARHPQGFRRGGLVQRFRQGGLVQRFQGGGRVRGLSTLFNPLASGFEIPLEAIEFGRSVRRMLALLARRLARASLDMMENVALRIRDEIRRLQRGGVTAAERARIRRLRAAMIVADFTLGRGIGRRLGFQEFRQQLGDLGFQRLELEQRLAGTFETGGGERAAFIQANLIPSLEQQIELLKRQERFASKTGDIKLLRETQLALGQKQNELLQAQLTAQELNNQILQEFATSLTFQFGGENFTDLMLRTGVGV